MQKKRTLWSQAGMQLLRELPLKPWATCRREDLLGLLAMLDQQIGKLDHAVQKAAEEHPQAKLLMTQPGKTPSMRAASSRSSASPLIVAACSGLMRLIALRCTNSRLQL